MLIDHSWPQFGLPLQPVFVFDKTKFFADPKLDARYNLYLEFDKTRLSADPNLDSRYNLYLYLIRLCSLLTPSWTPVTTCI